jgi:hypothetical protein
LWTVDNLIVPQPSAFTGDTGSGGTQGQVPAPPPASAAQGLYLAATGLWAPLVVEPPSVSIATNQAGYLGAPPALLTGNTILALNQLGFALVNTSASPITVTIPNDATVTWPSFVSIILLINPATSGTVTIVPASGVGLYSPPSFGSTGSRSLQANGDCVLKRFGPNTWSVVGAGIS